MTSHIKPECDLKQGNLMQLLFVKSHSAAALLGAPDMKDSSWCLHCASTAHLGGGVEPLEIGDLQSRQCYAPPAICLSLRGSSPAVLRRSIIRGNPFEFIRQCGLLKSTVSFGCVLPSFKKPIAAQAARPGRVWRSEKWECVSWYLKTQHQFSHFCPSAWFVSVYFRLKYF